jgi:Holliday junction resolvasome RuvABC ATP-dependent DNA helicase subunit
MSLPHILVAVFGPAGRGRTGLHPIVSDSPRWGIRVPVGLTLQRKRNIYIFQPLKIIAVSEKANFAGAI